MTATMIDTTTATRDELTAAHLALTVAVLKGACDDWGVTYKSKTTKPELVSMLVDAIMADRDARNRAVAEKILDEVIAEMGERQPVSKSHALTLPTQPMRDSERRYVYHKQTGRKTLTPKQSRRAFQKSRRNVK